MLGWLRHWLGKALPAPDPGASGSATGGWGGSDWLDAYRRRRPPTPRELVNELKGIAYACANINAAVCASYAPRLYVQTLTGQPAPRVRTRPVAAKTLLRLADLKGGGGVIEEVVAHPLLDLLRQVNPVHNAHDLLELTTLYQEITGRAYWLVDTDALGVPAALWPLPSQNVTPRRTAGSDQPVDWYEYRRPDGRILHYPASDVIAFRYPDPRDPYLGGLAPLAAAFESVTLGAEFAAYRTAVWSNKGMPSAIVSPADVISDQERTRIEAEWNQRFRRGGQGRVLVADSNLSVKMLETSPADLAALAEAGATNADIANAFGIPLPLVFPDTNLANLQSARELHALITVRPRLKRRDQKLNEQLVPRYDPTGRLFVESEDPLPDNSDTVLKRDKQDLETGVKTINEVRAERGLAPVPWGDSPWLPLTVAPTDVMGRTDLAPRTGRNSDPKRADTSA
ncbi:MAG: phage portal protein [Gemmataceae bacterium]